MEILASTQNSEVEEVAMSAVSRVMCRCPQSKVAVRAIFAVGVLVLAAVRLSAQGGSPGPLASSCGNPVAAEAAGQARSGRGLPPQKSSDPIFPPGQYPVRLPPASVLGARNDLPNPYRPGVSWGQLPPGRKWGSTASVVTAPDGTLWVADRCGEIGSSGANCTGKNAGVHPIFQFDKSGKLRKALGAGLFVNVHKIQVDKEGYLWVADNTGEQVFKMDTNGKILLTLGKKGVAGSGMDEFDAPTDVAIAPNGDIFVADGHSGGGMASGNARIMKFDKNGKFIMTWGRKGMGPGECRPGPCSCLRLPRQAIRRRPSEQPDTDFYPGRQVDRHVVPVWPAQHHLH